MKISNDDADDVCRQVRPGRCGGADRAYKDHKGALQNMDMRAHLAHNSNNADLAHSCNNADRRQTWRRNRLVAALRRRVAQRPLSDTHPTPCCPSMDPWSLVPQGYVYHPHSPSKLSSRMHSLPESDSPSRMRPHGVDHTGNEIFGGARRARGVAVPTFTDSPFIDEETRLANRFRPPPRPQAEVDKPPFLNGSFVPPVCRGTTWRTGDQLPLSLDGSPRAPRGLPNPNLARDPEISGGYGREVSVSEMLFDQKPAHLRGPPPNLDMQVCGFSSLPRFHGAPQLL